jgi:hypothetical protein
MMMPTPVSVRGADLYRAILGSASAIGPCRPSSPALVAVAPPKPSRCGAGSASEVSCLEAPVRLRHFTLAFSVSGNEEYVHLSLLAGAIELDLGARSHHYLLLTLARRRLRDASDGLPDTSCGWVHLEDWAHDPSMSTARINLDIHRIRKQFAARGLGDADSIVERRFRRKEIRLGPTKIQIARV